MVAEPILDINGPKERTAFSASRVKRAAIELALLAVLYLLYSVARTLASQDFAAARDRALELLHIERTWKIAWESWLNEIFVKYDWLGVFGSFWYATTHYIVTIVVLVWLYRRSRSEYVTARRALLAATVMGLAFYLLLPTAPPRLLNGMYVDVLHLHSALGWWGADASAPRGLGNLTNELAAFPSLHAGWSLWAALVLIYVGAPKTMQFLGLLYATTMTIVIVGTGNHWIIDAIAGWSVVLAAFAAVVAWERRNVVVTREGL